MTTQKKIHIAHIVDLRVIGGIERMLLAFIQCRADVSHTLVLFDQKIHPQVKSELLSLPQVVAIHSAKHWGRLRLPKSWRRRRRQNIIAQSGADVVLNWSQILDMNGITKPIVFYEHGSAWETYEAAPLQACYEPIHHCIAVSKAAKRMLQWHHGVKKPISVIENTVFQKPEIASKPRNWPSGRIVLGAAGRLVARKNFVVLLHAVAFLRANGHDVVLHIAGTGPQAEYLHNVVANLGLQDAVTLLGFVSDMDGFYQNIDVFVCPSIWESYGLVAIEAFAAGVPVVGAACDGLPEVVRDGVNGVCVPPTWDAEKFVNTLNIEASFASSQSYDPEQDVLVAQASLSPSDLAGAILQVIAEPEIYQAMSKAALQAALDIKSYQQLADEVLDSVKEAI